MVEWVCETEKQSRDNGIAKLGLEEYERRCRIAQEKKKQLGWPASTIVGSQFEPMAIQASQETFDKLAEKSASFWEKLVYKLAGV